MTHATDRRTLLRYAAAAAAFPVAAAASAHPAGGSFRFAPPEEPMLYTRRLERALPGASRLVVSRSFAVRFRPWEGGFLVEGEQRDVEVEAPEQLAQFARIEREREERGLFPLLLDAGGTIAGSAGTPTATRLDAAIREALAEIESRGHAPAVRAELVRFVSAFHQSAGRLVTELPHDLFAPHDAPRSERRAVALPGGDSGEVTVTFTAARDPATGLMRQALREVVTELGGERRTTLESWRLTLFAT